jgi:hypothetical protein
LQAILLPQIGDLLRTNRQNLEMSTKEPLGRISVPKELIAEARQLAKWEHATLSQVVRRALQREIDRMRATQRNLTGQDVASTQHLPIEQRKCGSSQGKDR